MDEPPRVQFPCEYPIKVVARTAPALRSTLDEVFARLAGIAALSRVSERPSAQGNFVSVTYVFEAQSEAQIFAIFQELKGIEHVMMVL
jgi:putative lipoic acid-binding regulatory protein